MALFTKSVQEKATKSDGVRVCIMRRPGEEVDWDIWMPHLSPSNEVLTARHNNTMTFEEHREWFGEHVFKDKREYLEIVIEMAKKRDVTLLCWERDPNTCHRKWVAEECKRLSPELKVVVK